VIPSSISTLRRSRRHHLLGGLLALAAALPAAAAELSFVEQSLELPGAPMAVIAGDVDGDAWIDLVVPVVYTEWDQIGIEESTTMDDVEGLVEVLTIVPTLMDRREVRVYHGRPGGGFDPEPGVHQLGLDVITLAAGPGGRSVVALTDEGLGELRSDAAGAPRIMLRTAAPPVLAATGNYLAGLDLLQDVTGDGAADVLLPAPDGIVVYPDVAGGPWARVPYPAAETTGGRDAAAGVVVDVPLPRVVDLNGDGLPDLLFRVPVAGGGTTRRMVLQTAPGRFAAAAPVPMPGGGTGGELVWVGPVDAAAGAEVVVADSLDDEDAGVRKEMQQAREPRHRVRLHPLTGGVDPQAPAAPSRSFVTRGWVDTGGGGDSGFTLPGGFLDLDGDGLTDLVTVTNDITLFKAMRVLATKRLTLDLGFLAWCQRPDGSFVAAPGEPMSSRLTIDLNDLELRQRSLFAGDFDGDGRRDFVQLGHEREIGIHLGRADCAYPGRPDRTLRLRAPLRDLALAEIADLDGDGRDDLAVTHPRPVDEAGESPAVRLDLYLSGGPAGGEGRGGRR
jgi:hypothetical protein